MTTTDVKIYKRQHEALVSIESWEAMQWVSENIKIPDATLTFRIPIDVVGDFAEELVKIGLIVEIS